jgi:hypothetical protein
MPVTVTNLTTTRTFNADAISLDVLADVIGTLIGDIDTSVYSGLAWTITNGGIDRALDAASTEIDELADIIATFVSDNPQSAIVRNFVVNNVSEVSTLDCNNTSITELANLLGQFVFIRIITRYTRRSRLTIPGSQQPNLR